ncbi:type II secretion system protein [Mucisphaera sp.]|uniref:type II secretion system protein n=1 Tax=Mucisphaera sp. TaxID=2913024 RepID=UPI003D110022
MGSADGVFVVAGRSRGLRPGAAGFTLIELLVVIAIIAMLIGLVMPSLGAARQSAAGVVCASNQRQLALANLAYAVEHDGVLVAGAPRFLENLRRWHGARDRVDEAFDPTRSPLWDYFGVAVIKECPSFAPDDVGFEAGNGGYGYNQRYLGTDDVDDLMTEGSARVDWVARPVETVHFTDAAFSTAAGGELRLIEYSFAEPPEHGAGFEAAPSIHFRHRGMANVVWLDGHVGGESLAFTRASVFYGVSEAANRGLGVGWFGPRDNSLFDLE